MNEEYVDLIAANSEFFNKRNRKLYEEDKRTQEGHIQKSRTLTDNSYSDIQKDIDEIPKNTKIIQKHQQISNDPPNQAFPFHYQIKYVNNDYIFEYQGSLNEKDFKEKTKILRAYPSHLRLTLFFAEKDYITRQRDFSLILVSCNQLKEKGNKQYFQNKYYEALDFYVEAYGLLRWIELKDKSFISYAKMIQYQQPILDEDIVECTSLLKPEFDVDESASSNDVICSILLCMSSCFMKLRHYKNAIECCDECLMYDENNTTALFRRSQARLYNKKSKKGDLDWGLGDIEKAIMILKENYYFVPDIYYEHQKLIKEEIEKYVLREANLVNEFVDDAVSSFKKIKNKETLRWKNGEIDESYKTQDLQSNVLKIMKKTYETEVREHHEVQRRDQCGVLCAEFGNFMTRYKMFQYFRRLDLQKTILIYTKNNQDKENILSLFKEKAFCNYMQHVKNKKADSVFQESNFNLKLIRDAISKVDQDLKKKEILENKLNLFYSHKLIENSEQNLIQSPKEIHFFVSIMLLVFSMLFMLSQLFLISQNKYFEG